MPAQMSWNVRKRSSDTLAFMVHLPLTIRINLIPVGEDAKFIEVEVGVQTLQGIEGPRHPCDALRERSLPLRQPEFVAEIEVAIRPTDRQYVQMVDHLPAFTADKTVGKADEG